MSTGIPGILKKSGDQVIHDLIQSGHGVDLDLNQVSIDRISTETYQDREVSFTINAREVGLDGALPVYGGQTSVIYERFVGDNYFSKFEWHIQLAPPFTVGRVLAALNAQTEVHWDLEDFKDIASFVLTVSSVGVTTLLPSGKSKRLFLEIAGSRMTVVITPPGRLNIARIMPPAVIQPPTDYFNINDTRTNLALRLPDANGVMVATAIKGFVADQVFNQDTGDTPVDWLTTVYGLADGFDVKWVCKSTPADYNLFGSKVLYNGPILPEHPQPYNVRLDKVLIFELSTDLCQNYYGKGIIYYNLSRDGV